MPQAVTHDKVLMNCAVEMNRFVETMEELGPKLGPVLPQVGYFNKEAFKSLNEFLARLLPYLDQIPAGHREAVDIRNKN